jgi:hypothetical protein
VRSFALQAVSLWPREGNVLTAVNTDSTIRPATLGRLRILINGNARSRTTNKERRILCNFKATISLIITT